jgi:integrase
VEIERIRINQVLFERSGKVPVIRIPIQRNQGKHGESRDVYVFENDVFDVRRHLIELAKWQKDNGNVPEAYLFSRPSDGKVPNYSKPFKILLNDTGLLLDPETQQERVPYSLRHYFATQALLRGQPDHIVAKWMGTSPQMIDQHYSKVKLRMKAAELAGTDDKLANIRARIRRDDAELKNEPFEQDEYLPDEIVYGSYFTEGSR